MRYGRRYVVNWRIGLDSKFNTSGHDQDSKKVLASVLIPEMTRLFDLSQDFSSPPPVPSLPRTLGTSFHSERSRYPSAGTNERVNVRVRNSSRGANPFPLSGRKAILLKAAERVQKVPPAFSPSPSPSTRARLASSHSPS